jgi:hypothetical protein
VSGQLHVPAALLLGKEPPCTHWIRDWVDPRAGLNDVEKRKFITLPGLELRILGRPARSQSLYQLCYPGSIYHMFFYNLCSHHVVESNTLDENLYPILSKTQTQVGTEKYDNIIIGQCTDLEECL